MKRLFLALTLVATAAMQAQTIEVLPATPAAQLVRSLTDGSTADIRNLYAPSGYQLVWTRNGQPTPQALAVVAQLEGAAVKGLVAADYDAGQWSTRLSTLRGDAALARFDVALTTSVMRYASHLRSGRVNPREVRFELTADANQIYLPAFVQQMTASADAAVLLASIEPQHDDYRRLLAALAKYRRIAAEAKNETALPVIPKLAAGQTYEGLPQLAALLRRNGDLAADAVVEGNVYQGTIVAAVKSFQSRHGLDSDGVIGRTTFAQLNVPAAQRVQQIEWAIERWRWIPAQLDGPAVIVNIPEFRLRARDGNGEELTMRVVVGKAAGHRTPVFDGNIKHVVFRPYWGVPPSIQRNEIAPKVAKDPGYLARNNYELVSASGKSLGSSVDADTLRGIRSGAIQVRQKPGTANALGLVKFLFPNDNNVYLHSTPQQALFARTRRDFSHGCIRVEDPVALAEWALRGQSDWKKEKIESTIHGKRDDVYVKIERPIAVMILYATAVADADGTVHFHEDIYGHDVQLAKVLAPQTRGAAVMLAAK
ncbi:MAG TPA: L,D-transpeptidase family protein [Thermoanaerobaculia bacterium]|nr:L,D-transpeptidase family protein [Thermoanaerobaculia bacterium]